MHATGRAKALDTLAQILRDRGDIDDARMLWVRAARLFWDRDRIGRAERIETAVRQLCTVTIPQARVEDQNMVSLPCPGRR
ncbi:hypothetical protein [Amycolatopsis kentuckyensis]|uniref:hypothetical protein n=1 Tax=Amycolatopsis kentuckyensis TaxID=218823 RepID=UPI001178B608|nr:hypothetical protein [Amycolatopsis kentuckyensis]